MADTSLDEVLLFYDIFPDGRIYSKRRNKFLTPTLKRSGYLQVILKINGVAHTWLVHRLVALVHLDPIEGKTVVNHINLNKTDNNVLNLEWCTSSENNRRRGNNKLSEGTECIIRTAYLNGETQQSIADRFNIDQGYVSQIINFKRRNTI